ncbi:TPA: type II toxin-antitoxin system death-on-curing family toxin [Yersinia enterocolitica]|uniref:type II toxin-antitoxin system death-on-curing family toxin n=1 Tax=Yersinia enterocolitica TaxID=630 RepID=UPI0005FCDF4F|nr:type II toxin-antitoxin system death-on-curing family toxin [Yersinia enterocolitica]EKN5933439.1 type II toxin-antitoxin system death-on-curing family toxin [Yersinia enterocolitica]ELX2273946.1 type II toxin-antitoxin system death-on-curing family toxin [Yersinia enterocolitica]ELY5259456.1 type II toxin-antitoxin system death-on-curing family toxin [Yersinia enterocolitica]CRE88579.1 Phage/plasmid maintenance toxin/antidote system protein (toxin) [Yersinia enterocolitica]HDL6630364.1 typ
MEDIILLNIEQVINIQRNTLPQGAVVDFGKLEGALSRVRNHQHYQNCNDKFELAALYLTAIAKAHAFADANKRTAFIACAAFLLANGIKLEKSSFYLTKLTVMVAGDKATVEETAMLLALFSDFYTQATNDTYKANSEEERIYYNLAIAMSLSKSDDASRINLMMKTVHNLIHDDELNAMTNQIFESYQDKN